MEAQLEERTQRCQEQLVKQDADAVILSMSSNLHFLTGFTDEPMERHLLCFVPSDGDPVYVVPEMYENQIQTESWVEDIRTWSDDTGPTTILESTIEELSLDGGSVLLDDTMQARFVLDLQKYLPNTSFARAEHIFSPLRMQKDETELKHLQHASNIADQVSEEIRSLGSDAVGLTERELAKRIRKDLLAEEGEELGFQTIVGSGENGAHPHHRVSDRVIEAGDPVVLDFGVTINGYSSDQTRTVVFSGEPPIGFIEVYDVVRAALDAGFQTVKPGVTAGQVDKAVRDIFEQHGFAEKFVHRTGHGVGLDIHEPPYIVNGNETELQPGMVFSIEPGAYLKDQWGIRIEDLVVVTPDGCHRLNDSPRTWRPLD
ncbi:Xaa-Pro peptidase family protein [Haladaptatus sp. SPP-AMP-3]|uniref:M24 family metallopeptidase n=1 Tax=Haladaptatus sp. SPP-AMP-3 TaxID=3121295 RepID=UPI003C30907B